MAAPNEAAKPSPAPESLVRETWEALPQQERGYKRICQELRALNYRPPARATLFRWSKAWQGLTVPTTVPKRPTKEQIEQFDPISIASVPDELKDALGLRMLIVAHGEGLDRVESAIVKVATDIAKRSERIAELLLKEESESEEISEGGAGTNSPTTTRRSKQNNAGQKAIQTLAVLADAMHRITASRVLFSVAYRNFGEGDMLTGTGDKSRAEAQTLIDASRAANAKDITPPGGRLDRYADQSEEDEAQAALRDLEDRK